MNGHLSQQLSAAYLVAAALAASTAVLQGQTPASVEQPGGAQASIAGASQTLVPPQRLQPTHEEIGDSLMAHQRYQAAIEEYKREPNSLDALNKMGVSYQLMFNLSDAQRCYQTVLKKDPRNAVAWNNMGSVYMNQKLYGTAERTYRKAVKLDPKSALFRKNLGTALLAEHNYKKGWQSYQEALKLDPEIFTRAASVRVENPSTVQDRGAMNYYMAKGCLKAGRPERAIYYLRLALNEGFTTPKKILADNELASLHDNPEFQQMLAAQGVYLTDPSSIRPVRQ